MLTDADPEGWDGNYKVAQALISFALSLSSESQTVECLAQNEIFMIWHVQVHTMHKHMDTVQTQCMHTYSRMSSADMTKVNRVLWHMPCMYVCVQYSCVYLVRHCELWSTIWNKNIYILMCSNNTANSKWKMRTKKITIRKAYPVVIRKV